MYTHVACPVDGQTVSYLARPLSPLRIASSGGAGGGGDDPPKPEQCSACVASEPSQCRITAMPSMFHLKESQGWPDRVRVPQ